MMRSGDASRGSIKEVRKERGDLPKQPHATSSTHGPDVGQGNVCVRAVAKTHVCAHILRVFHERTVLLFLFLVLFVFSMTVHVFHYSSAFAYFP